MEKRTIVIACRDTDYLNGLAGCFRKTGYRVETAASVAHLVDRILADPTAVLILDSDLDRRVSPSDLIHLLKRCRRGLQVIVISDQITLPLARLLRPEGLFYHALKPADAGDCEELALAVDSAFAKNAGPGKPLPQGGSARDEPNLPGSIPPQSTPGRHLPKVLPWMLALFALFGGAGYLAVAIVDEKVSTMVCIFFGFFALIVVTQLLPIFRSKLPARVRAAARGREPGALHGK